MDDDKKVKDDMLKALKDWETQQVRTLLAGVRAASAKAEKQKYIQCIGTVATGAAHVMACLGSVR